MHMKQAGCPAYTPRTVEEQRRPRRPAWFRALFLVVLPWATPLQAQWGSTNLDSLIPLLNPHERSFEQLQRYTPLAMHWLVSAKAMRYLPQVDTLTRHLIATSQDTSLLRYLWHVRSNYHYRMGYQRKFNRDVPGALYHFERSWAILDSIGPPVVAINAVEAIGVLYEAVGETDLAMRYYRMCLDRLQQAPQRNAFTEGSVLRHIASVQIDKGNYGQAEAVLAGCDTSIGDVHVLVETLRARMRACQGDTTGADAAYQRAVVLVQPPQSEWGRIDPLAALARLRHAHRDHRGALKAAEACADIAARTGDEAAWCTAMILAGKAQSAMGDHADAGQSFRAALDTARAYDYHGLARITGNEGSMVEAADLLRKFYLRNGHLREAMDMTTYWSLLKDTLNSKDGRLEVLRHSMRTEALADSMEAASTIVLTEQQRAEADLRATVAGQRTTVIAIVALLLAVVVMLLYRTIRNRQRLADKERELYHEQVDQLLSQQEIKSMNAMLEGQEQERERVSKELHDHVGHLLGSIKHQLGVLETQVADVKTEQSAQYRKVSSLLDNAAGELRRISHDMAAATLNRFGLEKALKELRDTLHINGHLQVELNTFGLERSLGRGVEFAVYRIIQEAVSNVLKHAKASEITIGVTHMPGLLSVLVSDDGSGFDPKASSGGTGLGNVRARAAAMGAQVQIDSAPGRGTTVSVECPVLE